MGMAIFQPDSFILFNLKNMIFGDGQVNSSFLKLFHREDIYRLCSGNEIKLIRAAYLFYSSSYVNMTT